MLACIVALLLIGCASRPTLSGSDWMAEVSGQSATMSFANDGSMKMSLELPIGTLTSSGTFSETDKSVAFTLQKINLPNLPIPGGAGKLVEGMVGRPLTFNVEWLGPDEVKLSPQLAAGPLNQTMTLKRKPKS